MKHLPHDLDAERAVLGAALLDPRTLPVIAAVLEPADLHHPAHAALYGAIVDLDAASLPVDETAVLGQMARSGSMVRLKGVGGAGYLAELVAGVVTTANVAHHARTVRALAVRRRIVETCHDVIGAALASDAPDPVELVDDAAQRLLALAATDAGGGLASMRQAIGELTPVVEARYEAHRTGARIPDSVPTGFPTLDADLAGGFRAADLIILAARPSMGKSALAQDIGRLSSALGFPVAIFSVEMSRSQWTERTVSADGSIPSSSLRSGALRVADWGNLSSSAASLVERPIWIDETPSIPLRVLRSRARRWRMDEKQGGASSNALVVIDYLQLITVEEAKGRNREQEIASISRGLKALAKELRCPVLALSQLNRGLESRGDKRPTLADLRESGQIEQDADTVLFLYRDEVYDKETQHKGEAEVIIAKQRCGPLGTSVLRWRPAFTRFEEMR